MFEYNYHPDNFKRKKCPYYEQKKFCRLGAKCFRYHENNEAKIWQIYWDSLKSNEGFIQASPLNGGLGFFYQESEALSTSSSNDDTLDNHSPKSSVNVPLFDSNDK